MESSGATSNVVLNVSWYSDCRSEDKGKNTLFVCSVISPMRVSNSEVLAPPVELLLINMTSKYDVLEIESTSTC
jgi:hypothetical protein